MLSAWLERIRTSCTPAPRAPHVAHTRAYTQPYALAIALVSIFFIFIVEIVAFRWGTAKLARLGITHDPHGHGLGAHDGGVPFAHGPGLNDEPRMRRTPSSSQQAIVEEKVRDGKDDIEAARPDSLEPLEQQQSHAHGLDEKHAHQGHGHGHEGALVDSAATQIIGVAILEFGVILHRFVPGSYLEVFTHRRV